MNKIKTIFIASTLEVLLVLCVGCANLLLKPIYYFCFYNVLYGILLSFLNDENERVRIEAPEMFRVLGKRTPELVRPYLEKLEYIATHDEVSVVRIHAKGAIRAILSKTIKEPDAKTQNKQVR